MKAVFVVLAIGLMGSGCAPSHAPGVVRVIRGVRHEGTVLSPYSTEWFIRGEIAASKEKWREAAEAYRRATAGPSDDPYLLAKLADALEHASNRAAADEVLEDGLSEHPDSEALWLARGSIARRRNHIEEAIRSYEHAYSVAPESEEAPLALFWLLRSQGAEIRGEAILARFLRTARHDQPNAIHARLALAFARGDAERAVQLIEALLRVSAVREEELNQAIQIALRSEQPLLAARILDRVLPRPGDQAVRIRALLASGRREEAEAALSITDSETLGGLLAQARLYLDAGRPERAEEIAAAAVATENPEPEAWIVLGHAKLLLGHFDEAAVDFAKVPMGARGFVESRLGLASALRAGGLANIAREVLAAAAEEDSDVRLKDALASLRNAPANAHATAQEISAESPK